MLLSLRVNLCGYFCHAVKSSLHCFSGGSLTAEVQNVPKELLGVGDVGGYDDSWVLCGVHYTVGASRMRSAASLLLPTRTVIEENSPRAGVAPESLQTLGQLSGENAWRHDHGRLTHLDPTSFVFGRGPILSYYLSILILVCYNYVIHCNTVVRARMLIESLWFYTVFVIRHVSESCHHSLLLGRLSRHLRNH